MSCGCLKNERVSARSVVDITGQRFGRLVVVGRAGTNADRKATWRCRCDCGNDIVVCGKDMRVGDTNSCGCLAAEKFGAVITKHGGVSTPEYRVYSHMIGRCSNPGDTAFRNYGGRGISVCDRWRESFAHFLADMGPRPSPAHSIDRIDNDGHYEPSNCRWALMQEQARNKQNTVYLEHDGRRLPLPAWAEMAGLPPNVLRSRIRNGWPVERALTAAYPAPRKDSRQCHSHA